jgi:hypothetical protein
MSASKGSMWTDAQKAQLDPYLNAEMPRHVRAVLADEFRRSPEAIGAMLTELRKAAGFVIARGGKRIPAPKDATIQRRCVNTDCRAEFETTSPFIRRCPACSQRSGDMADGVEAVAHVMFQ